MSSFVYLIAHCDDAGRYEGPVKVGITKSLTNRVAALQTGNPVPITLVFSFATPDAAVARWMEGSFHEIAKDRRLTGEWFEMTPRDALALLTSCFWAGICLEIPDAKERAVLLEWCGYHRAVSLFDDMDNRGALH